jgi:CBS domain containing-hemolysin-like protein
MLTLIAIVAVALTVSFLCSLWEAALLSIRTGELRSRASEGEAAAARLLTLKTKKLDESLSAILTLNTVSHTVGAASAGAQAARLFGDTGLGVFSAILTLLVLVLTEAIPKTLGANHASRLVGFVANSLNLLVKTPLAMLAIFTRWISRTRTVVPPSLREIISQIDTANQLGGLSDPTAHFLIRALELENTVVGDVAHARALLPTLSNDTSVGRAREEAKAADTRWVLISAADGADQWLFIDTERLPANPQALCRDYAVPALHLPERTGLSMALSRWMETPARIIGVFDERGDTVGLISTAELEKLDLKPTNS